MPVESEIRARVEAFAADLVSLIKSSALDVVHEALGESPGGRRRASLGSAVGLLSSREKGAKRDPQVLEALVERLGAFVIKNPGKRIEEIGSELAIATKELALPVKKLIAAKRISTKGQRRATTYYPAGGRGPAKAAEKSPAKASGRQPKSPKKARKARSKSKAKAKGPARAKSKAPGRPKAKATRAAPKAPPSRSAKKSGPVSSTRAPTNAVETSEANQGAETQAES